jgi:hypothetical protein
MPSTLQVDKIIDGSATTNKELAEYSSSAWSWGTGVPAGTVLQVLQAIKTDKDSITGIAQSDGTNKNSFAYIPGQGGGTSAGDEFQQGITTTGSNKVLVQIAVNLSCNTVGFANQVAVFRGSASTTVIGSATKIAVGTEPLSNQSSSTGQHIAWSTHDVGNIGMTWLDSPGAGTHYYKLGWLGESNKIMKINSTGVDGNYAYSPTLPSTLTVMEIAA